MKKDKRLRDVIYQYASKYSSNQQELNELLSSRSFQMNEEQGTEFIKHLVQRSLFLQRINIILVSNVSGSKIKGALTKPATGRNGNFQRYLSEITLDPFKFELKETDSGILIKWDLFDHLATLFHTDLSESYSEYILNQIVSDILQIGWHGESIAENTTDVNMADVNKGWLALLAEQKPENFIQQGKEQNKIKIFGDNADYHSLNELAFSLRKKLAEKHQYRNDLVFLVGNDLLSKEDNILLNNLAYPNQFSDKYFSNVFGGMITLTPPNFPTKAAVVTTLNNLSIYTDPKTWRYSIRNDEDNKQIINSLYRQECYVIEDLSLIAAINHHNVILD